jgi:hypothetical protein
MAGFYTRIVRRSALRAFCLIYENHSVWRLLYLDWLTFHHGVCHERLLRVTGAVNERRVQSWLGMGKKKRP